MWDEVYSLLRETCDAPERAREEFVARTGEFREFRFMGGLGLGGKIYRMVRGTQEGVKLVMWVSCYSEDETPTRRAMIDAANIRLRAYWQDV